MWIKDIYSEPSTEALLDFVRQNPLGILTTGIPSTIYPHLQSTHIPWVLDRPENPDETTKGRLRGHIAKQNPQYRAIVDTLAASNAPSGSILEQEVLVLFNGPHQHYVTPKFYTETKPATGKVAPTWNYAAVQVYGRARVYFESSQQETQTFLSQQLHDLSEHCERNVMGYTGEEGRDCPWLLSDAPVGYIDILKKAIAGVEISIDRIEGSFKMSQEKGKGDREGVIQGFQQLGSDAGDYIACSVKGRGEIKDAKQAQG